MLFTLTTTHRPATDLGFLLHKHPDKHQEFSLPFGTAHVFYPEADAMRCTAALVLDVDPIALVRGRRSAKGDAGCSTSM
jgi:RNA repair, ligase-Pnkp-associating, region of Hen1